MNAKKFLIDSSSTEISLLFKTMLNILEDLKFEHALNQKKLLQNIPEEHWGIIKSADYFNNDKYAWMRKRVLDNGNGALRKLNEELEKVTVSFIFNK